MNPLEAVVRDLGTQIGTYAIQVALRDSRIADLERELEAARVDHEDAVSQDSV